MPLPAQAPLSETGTLRGRAPGLEAILDRARRGETLDQSEARRLVTGPEEELEALCAAATELRDRGHGRTVTYSPKVFIPLTRLCRDYCGYCTFRIEPDSTAPYMTLDEVLAVARAGERAGCHEALFTLGERPEQRYPEARGWLSRHGYRSTAEYLRAACEAVLAETRLLPHLNPGTLSRREMSMLRPVCASMGIMLESVSPTLHLPGAAHEHAPSKRPRVRLRTLELAGELRVPFTTGLLIGIGDAPREQVDGLLAIRDLHRRYGHVQEVIIQNFRAKPSTPMHGAPDAAAGHMLRVVAAARLVLGPAANIQVPPNLSANDYPDYLDAGINDWGGVSPLTIDYVNPEAPWPQLAELRRRTEEHGLRLRARLPVYPEYIRHRPQFLPEGLRERITASAGTDGLAMEGAPA